MSSIFTKALTSMTIQIIEDEVPAARRLQNMIQQIIPESNILPIIDSVRGAVDFFRERPALDLLFLDIQLADGQSFDIFSAVEVTCPVIFTTAYDKFTLQAFKVNSIDYLLKPIDGQELRAAIDQYNNYRHQQQLLPAEQWQQLLQAVRKPTYKERFMIRAGEEIRFISVDDIQYFFSEQGMVFAQLADRRKFHIDYTLEQLESLLDPNAFFRISRKFIVALRAIDRIFTYFNSRLKLQLKPATPSECIVSRDRVSEFKQWIDR